MIKILIPVGGAIRQLTGNNLTGYNSSYKKLAVQWLNEALCFVSSSVVADSFRLRNRQLLVATNRYGQFIRTQKLKTVCESQRADHPM